MERLESGDLKLYNFLRKKRKFPAKKRKKYKE